MLDTTALKNELQARINALTNASSFDQVVDVAIAERKAAQAGIVVSRSNLANHIQRITNAVGSASGIDELIVLAASVTGDSDGLPIGSVAKFPFSGEKFTDNNLKEWLLSGLLHTKEGYERALELPGLRYHGVQIYAAKNATSGVAIKGASDGLGNTVIACGNDTNVIVIKNHGETVLAVPHNLPGKAVTVECVAGQFIVAGNSASAIFSSYSSNGGDSFSASSNDRSISGATVDTLRSAAGTAGAMFVCQGTASGVFKSSGDTKTAIALPASINSYVPIIEHFEGAFIISQRNSINAYRTFNNGANFSLLAKPPTFGTVIDERCVVALGRFFWAGQSGSTRYHFHSSDLVTWHDTFELFPEAVKQFAISYGASATRITLHSANNGLVIVSSMGNYFTTDLENWEQIAFSLSTEELGRSGAHYRFEGQYVFGGADPYTDTGASLRTSVLKFDASNPDYVGCHEHGLPPKDSGGFCEYVRIK